MFAKTHGVLKRYSIQGPDSFFRNAKNPHTDPYRTKSDSQPDVRQNDLSFKFAREVEEYRPCERAYAVRPFIYSFPDGQRAPPASGHGIQQDDTLRIAKRIRPTTAAPSFFTSDCGALSLLLDFLVGMRSMTASLPT
jgi:hypothetical protein